MGVVEGLTEYLPVSSTGHLILTERALGIAKSEANDAYAICIQGGAILAVLGVYFGRVKQMTRGLLGKDDEGRRLAINVVAGFIPTGVGGLLLNKIIKAHLLGLIPICVAWFVGGAAILLLAWYPRNVFSRRLGDRPRMGMEGLTWQTAALIGLIQCLGMWPGTSRSLVTIAGGLLVGMTLAAAVEFSFLLGVVTLLAATAHDGYKSGSAMVHDLGLQSMLIGVIAAAVAAGFAVKWMVSYLNKHGMAAFGYYRVALAMVVVALMVMGVLETRVEERPAPQGGGVVTAPARVQPAAVTPAP